MLLKKIERQCKRAIGFLLAGESRHFGLHPAIFHRYVQHERPVQVFNFANIVLDVSAVIRDRAVDIGSTAHQVTQLAAKAVAAGGAQAPAGSFDKISSRSNQKSPRSADAERGRSYSSELRLSISLIAGALTENVKALAPPAI